MERHIAAQDYRHVGALPNNFAKTLPMVQATKAVRSFRDEYLLELVNLDNVDAVYDQDVDERVLSKGLVANIEKTIAALGGNDFCFMGREKRLIVEGEELFIDLLCRFWTQPNESRMKTLRLDSFCVSRWVSLWFS